MQKYELLLTLPGTLDEKEVEEKSNTILEIVKTIGSNVEIHNLGKIRLAYPIKQIRYGYFFTIVFQSEKSGARILEEKLRHNREILRFMITYFNTTLTAGQKIIYNTNSTGVTTMQEKIEENAHVRVENKTPVNLEDINKRLDEILDDGLISGV